MIWTAAAFGLVFLGCSDHTDTASICDDDLPLTWDNWGDGFFASYCRSCHSESTKQRYGAPDSVDFDDVEDVQLWAERIHVRTIAEQTMPPGGGVLEEDLEFLSQYLQCLEPL